MAREVRFEPVMQLGSWTRNIGLVAVVAVIAVTGTRARAQNPGEVAVECPPNADASPLVGLLDGALTRMQADCETITQETLRQAEADGYRREAELRLPVTLLSDGEPNGLRISLRTPAYRLVHPSTHDVKYATCDGLVGPTLVESRRFRIPGHWYRVTTGVINGKPYRENMNRGNVTVELTDFRIAPDGTQTLYLRVERAERVDVDVPVVDFLDSWIRSDVNTISYPLVRQPDGTFRFKTSTDAITVSLNEHGVPSGLWMQLRNTLLFTGEPFMPLRPAQSH